MGVTANISKRTTFIKVQCDMKLANAILQMLNVKNVSSRNRFIYEGQE